FVLPVKLRLRPLLGAHSGAPAAQASPPEMRWRLLYALFSQLVLELALKSLIETVYTGSLKARFS
ncbi:MAG: hypothetical protein U0N52_01465, partial [Muribaculaceae bacterium]